MKICWGVLKEDIISAAAGVAALLLFFAPVLVLQHFTEYSISAMPVGLIEALMISVSVWFVVLIVLCVAAALLVVVLEAIVEAIDRYTDVWSECGEHGSQGDSCDAS